MKILAIDTSASACSVALMLADEIHTLHEIAPMQQAQMILPMIDKILRQFDMALNQLDALAFGCGPGSFTGVRIATSVMQGLAFATNVPLIKISSLAAIAQATYNDLGWEKILVAVDARIQETYWAAYQINAAGLMTLASPERVSAPTEIILPQGEWFGAGNAWEVYQQEITAKPIKVDTTRLPEAAAITLLAKEKFLRQEWVEPAAATPVYLRDNVAKKSRVD